MKSNWKPDLSNWRGDLFGGLTAGIVALPLALAFGAQTELGAIAGLYGAIALGVLAAALGGTPVQVSGPTAPMTVVSAVVILEAIEKAGSLAEAFPLIIATFFLAGGLQILLGVLKIGKYIRYIPYPVVSGFMTGIGVIIILGQIFPFVGTESPAGGSIGVLRNLGDLPGLISWPSVLLAAGTVAVIYLFPRLTKAVPGSLVALILFSLLAFFLFQGQVSLINDTTEGGVPSGLPRLRLDFWRAFADWEQFSWILQYGITLAALGAIDSLLTSVVADNLTKTRHDSNRELWGQGLGNIGAALLGGLPGAGATMRTVVNVKAGGKTRLSGIMAGVFLLVVLLGLGPLVGRIPNAVLAGILVTVGIGIIDYKSFRHLRSIPRSDALIMLVVLFFTVFLGLLQAVAIGMVMASLLFMKAIADTTERLAESGMLRAYSQEVPWEDEAGVLDRIGDRVFIKRLEGPLFFGLTAGFQERVKAMPNVCVVIIRMGRVPYVDQSGLYAMEEAVQDLIARGIPVVFAGLKDQPKDMFQRIKLVPGLIPAEHSFENFREAALWLEQYLKEDKIEKLLDKQRKN
jgi:SulP family sulfate permease